MFNCLEIGKMENASNGMCKRTFQDQFEAYLKAQMQEIDKYKWCLGEKLKHDPLQDRSYDEICMEWIGMYAADFRKNWNN